MNEMKRYSVGIDLGTSNTVLAYAEAGSQRIRVFEIEQLVSPGEVAARPLLPARWRVVPAEAIARTLLESALTAMPGVRVVMSEDIT